MVKITVGMATCGVSAGAARVFETFRGLIGNDGGRATLQATGCLGMCYREPLVEIDDGTVALFEGLSSAADVIVIST